MQRIGYLRHRNGNGKIYDISEADHHSFVDRHSELRNETSIWRSKVLGSQIIDSLISDSIVKNSSIMHSTVHSGSVERSIVSCEFIGQNAKIVDCTITGHSRISGAVCENVKFSNLTVTGSAILRNWPESSYQTDDTGSPLPIDFAHGYITRGVWTRPPRIFKISPTITLSEGVPGFVFTHCREYEINYLLKIGRRLGAASNWTADEVLAVRRCLHFLKAQHGKNNP